MIGNNNQGAAGGGASVTWEIPPGLKATGNNGLASTTQSRISESVDRLSMNFQNFLFDIQMGVGSSSSDEFLRFLLADFAQSILKEMKVDESNNRTEYMSTPTLEEMFIAGKVYGRIERGGETNDKIAEILHLFKKP